MSLKKSSGAYQQLYDPSEQESDGKYYDGYVELKESSMKWTQHWCVIKKKNLHFFKDVNTQISDNYVGYFPLEAPTHIAIEGAREWSMKSSDGKITLRVEEEVIRDRWIKAFEQSMKELLDEEEEIRKAVLKSFAFDVTEDVQKQVQEFLRKESGNLTRKISRLESKTISLKRTLNKLKISLEQLSQVLELEFLRKESGNLTRNIRQLESKTISLKQTLDKLKISLEQLSQKTADETLTEKTLMYFDSGNKRKQSMPTRLKKIPRHRFSFSTSSEECSDSIPRNESQTETSDLLSSEIVDPLVHDWTIQMNDFDEDGDLWLKNIRFSDELRQVESLNSSVSIHQVIYREFCQINGVEKKLMTIENYHSMLFSIKIAVFILGPNRENIENATCERSLKIVYKELCDIEASMNVSMRSLVFESVTRVKTGVLLLFNWLMRQSYVKKSDERQRIRRAFEESFEKASEAFFSKSSTGHIILASKLRIISKILESFSKPEVAALCCLQLLQELHDMREIRQLFSHLDGEKIVTVNKDVTSVLRINKILLVFVGKFLKPPPTVEDWPATIPLDGKNYNPLIEEKWYRLEPKIFPSVILPQKSQEKAVSEEGDSEQAVVSSIKIDKQGGCFCVLAASDFLIFPPNAVQEEFTLTCSQVEYKDCEVKPRNGEAFVGRILKIEPEGVVFRKPVTVLLSHSVYEDQDFLDFYELVVINLDSDEREELETERINSLEEVPKEILKPEILNDDLPFAKATIYETCTLVAAARFKSDQVLVPTNKTRVFSKKYGENKEVKITFPAGVTQKILCLTVQLFPADAVLNRDVYLDENLVCAPIIKVSGQTGPFLKPVNVELLYSNDDVANIDENFLPVGEKTQFTIEYGLLLRSHRETESKLECLETLNESHKVYVERLRKDQLKFSFQVEHFCKLCPTIKKRADVQLPKNEESSIVNPTFSINIKFYAYVWAVHDCKKSFLYAMLTPRGKRRRWKWNVVGKYFGCKLKPNDKVYVCVPLDNNTSHLPLDDCVLRFDNVNDYELPNHTSKDVNLEGKCMYFLVKECSGKNHDLRVDGRVKVVIHNPEENLNMEVNQSVSEPFPNIVPMEEDGVFASQDVMQNGHMTSQNETVRRNISRCGYFEGKVEEIFVTKLGMNKDEMKRPNVGPITKVMNDLTAMTSVILGLGVGVTIALSVGSFGIGSIVGATVAGITFTVTKVDKKLKKCYAEKIDKKLEIYFHCHLKCIIMDVAKELSRMFEYQLFALQDEKQVEILAACAVDLMLDLKKGDQFDRNTLLKKVLQDGSMKKRELITRNSNKWLAPDVFRKPGLRRMNVGTDRAELKYFVKPENACDTNTYNYRGQFLEKKKYCLQNEEDEKMEVTPFRKKPTVNETNTCEHPRSCEVCSYFYENCTSGQYFVESSIDNEYSEPCDEILTYQPVHILIQCPKVLDSFIHTLQIEKQSLANFLKKKLGLPMNHVVHPVYRRHSPGKGPDLKKSILTGSDFSHSDFTDSSLEECDFTNCVLLFAELSGAKLSHSKFVDTLISHSNLVKVKADHCEWTSTFVLYSRVDDANLDSVVPTVGGNCFNGTNICDAITAVPNETTV